MSKYAIKVEAKNQSTADLIEEGLKDEMVRAFVTLVAALIKLPSKRAQTRVMNYVNDYFDEKEQSNEPSTL